MKRLCFNVWKTKFQAPGVLVLIFCSIFFGNALIFPVKAQADSGIFLLQYGTWGLTTHPDPFRGKYPAVMYVAPGTIVFKKKSGKLKDYNAVQLHFGNWVQIAEKISIKGQSINVLTPIEGLVKPPPSNTIMIHRSILCLGQTNHIINFPEKCDQVENYPRSTIPVGKGWIYTFKQDKKPNWWDLSVKLDSQTKAALRDRGLSPEEANFDITKTDLQKLEGQGYLTILNKKYPIATFSYRNPKPIYIHCGQTKVTEKELKVGAAVTVAGEASLEPPSWTRFITGLKAKLGVSGEGRVEGGVGTTWTITIDTSEASYLYYSVQMKSSTGEISNIIVEKTFECKPSPNVGPGNKILSVRFELEPPGNEDIQEFEFTKPNEYLATPDDLYSHHPRPVFLSVNSPQQYSAALKRIIDKWNVDAHLAHFMLANINYSCSGRGNTRKKCAELIDKATN